MPVLPSAAAELLMSFSVAFSEPTFCRMVGLLIGAILAPRQRTVTSMIWTVRSLVKGHYTNYHRLFSRARWSAWTVARILSRAVVALVPEGMPLVVALDDTVAQHRGKRVYGKGCHRDAVRSAARHLVYRWGHRWIVVAVLVQVPFITRAWALPVAAVLFRPESLNRAERRRHKTAVLLARQLMAVLLHWFPRRTFIFLGDGGYAAHELAQWCHRQPGGRAVLVSRFHADAALYAPPPTRRPGQAGRPRVKGDKLAQPQQVVAESVPRQTVVDWYGGSSRRVALISDVGHWYRGGGGLVELRWVYVKDLEGTHRSDYFYSTDVRLSPEAIVSLYTRRWSLETTFQEVRAHLGFETTRQWVKRSVLRMGPLLLGLFSLVALIYAECLKHHPPRIAARPWYAKAEPTFSDALSTVRRLFWAESCFSTGSAEAKTLQKLPPELRNFILDRLSQAA